MSNVVVVQTSLWLDLKEQNILHNLIQIVHDFGVFTFEKSPVFSRFSWKIHKIYHTSEIVIEIRFVQCVHFSTLEKFFIFWYRRGCISAHDVVFTYYLAIQHLVLQYTLLGKIVLRTSVLFYVLLNRCTVCATDVCILLAFIRIRWSGS